MSDEKEKEEVVEHTLDVDNELRFEIEAKNSKVIVEVRFSVYFVAQIFFYLFYFVVWT